MKSSSSPLLGTNKPDSQSTANASKASYLKRQDSLSSLISIIAGLSPLLPEITTTNFFLRFCNITSLVVISMLFLRAFRSQKSLLGLILTAIFSFYMIFKALILSESLILYRTLGALMPVLFLQFTNNWKAISIIFCSQFLFLTFIQSYHNKIQHVEEILTHFESFHSTLLITLTLLTLSGISFYISKHKAQKKLQESSKNSLIHEKNFYMNFSDKQRNLLNGIIGNLEILGEENCGSPHPNLTSAKASSELLLNYLTNIHDRGKMLLGELETTILPSRVHHSLEKVWATSIELLKAKNLTGCLKITKEIPRVLKLDPYRFEQVMLSMIDNAIKFTKTGFIIMTLEWLNHVEKVDEDCFKPEPYDEDGVFEKDNNFTMAGRRKHSTNDFYLLDMKTFKFKLSTFYRKPIDNKGVLKISLSDTGPGMGLDVIKNFQTTTFERYNNLENGIIVSTELCKKMNGDLKIYSRIGSGTAVTICIPAEVEPEVPEILDTTSLLEPRDISVKRLRALIVEDSEFNVEVISSYLKKLQVEIVGVAKNGIEGHSKFIEYSMMKKVDIVTMDINMPILNGKETCKRIRAYENEMELSPTLIIMISGNTSDSEVNECLDREGEIKADVFLKKPATFEQVSQAIYRLNKTRKYTL